MIGGKKMAVCGIVADYTALVASEKGWHSYGNSLILPEDIIEDRIEKYAPYSARIMAILRHSNQIYLNCLSGNDGAEYIKWLEQHPEVTVSDFGEVYKQLRRDVMQIDTEKNMGNLARCHLPNGKTIWLCPDHQNLPRITVLTEDVGSANPQASIDTEEEALMVAALQDPSSSERMKEESSGWPALPVYSPLSGYVSDDGISEVDEDDDDEDGDDDGSQPMTSAVQPGVGDVNNLEDLLSYVDSNNENDFSQDEYQANNLPPDENMVENLLDDYMLDSGSKENVGKYANDLESAVQLSLESELTKAASKGSKELPAQRQPLVERQKSMDNASTVKKPSVGKVVKDEKNSKTCNIL